MKGKRNRAEAYQSEGGLIPLYHFTLEWLRRNSAFTSRSLLRGASFFIFFAQNPVPSRFFIKTWENGTTY
jgi:hypothetical protein